MWNQTGRKATNSILLLTLAPRFICGTKMKFDQMNLEVLFPAIAIRSEVIRTHKAVLFLWQVDSLYFCKPQFLPPWASSLWKLTPLVLSLGLWRPTATQWTMLSTFVYKIEESLSNVTSSASLHYQNKDGGPLSQNGVVLAGFEELVLENYTSLHYTNSSAINLNLYGLLFKVNSLWSKVYL